MHAEATGLIEEGGRVVGVRATIEGRPEEIRADLVVGADGRHSTVREAAGFRPVVLGAPMDVLWFRLSHKPADSAETMGRFDRGSILVMLDRGDYWQCAYVIAKGSAETLKAAGIEKFRERIVKLMPFLADRVHELATVDDLKLLTVGVDRLEKWWKPGLLCIGDAAHTMSPIGGVGVNIAVQDAVAAANILAGPLKEGRLKDSDLAAVQERRRWPVRATQAIQVFLQNRMIAPTLAGTRPLRPPWPARLLNAVPFLRRIPARVLGMGVQPEHVRRRRRLAWIAIILTAAPARLGLADGERQGAPRSASSLAAASSVNLPSAKWFCASPIMTSGLLTGRPSRNTMIWRS